MFWRRLVLCCMMVVVLVCSGAGCGGEKGKGANSGRDVPTRPEKR